MLQRKILVHGVIARGCDDISKKSPLGWGWRTYIKMARDRALWVFGSTGLLDYRNYDAPYPSNVGDIAIAEAVRNQFLSSFPDTSFENVNWGNLGDGISCKNIYHAIVMAGSGYFHISREGSLGDRIEKDLMFIKRSNAPIILYGVGVNRGYQNSSVKNSQNSLTENSEALITEYLQHCSLISVRGNASKMLLTRYTDKNIQIIGDPALFLNVEKPNKAVSGLSGQIGRPKIGVNFANHGPLASSILRSNLPLYLDLLRKIYDETHCSFHYFVHSHSESIIPLLLQDKGVNVEIISGNPYQLSAKYSEMTLHIGNMLHSCILAVGAGVPCILLAYDVKHQGFAEIFGLTPHCHDVTKFTAKEVMKSMRQLLSENILWRKTIVECLSELWSAQQQFASSCASLLNVTLSKSSEADQA